jgi:anti-sigma B factor antagonist
MEFAITRREGVVTLKVAGELDALSVTDLRPSVEGLASEEPKHVIVDLSGLRVIDSSGVGAIVSLFKRVRAYGGRFEVREVQGQPLSIFKVLRLDRVFMLE